MRILGIYSYFIGIEIVFNYAVGLNEAYLKTSAMGWWEARRGCIEDGSDLFVPSGTIYVPPQMGIATYYWVGGFEASQWRWTDNSPLFTLIGHYPIPNVEYVVEIAGNSVIECYGACGENIIGLSGSICYCLGELNIVGKYEETLDTNTCPGNQDEECGTDSSISVYRTDIDFRLYPDKDGQCGYAHVNSKRVKLKSSNCNSEFFSVCDHDNSPVDPSCRADSIRPFSQCETNLCLTCGSDSWSASNQTCTLAKVTPLMKEEVVSLLTENIRYWVGLRKRITRRWANGEEVEDHFYTRFTDPSPRCLALFLAHSTWYAHWIPCIVKLPSLCTKGQNAPGTADMLSEGDSTDIVTMPTIATRDHGETEPKPLENTRTVEASTEVTTEKGGNIKTAGMVDGNDMVPDKNVKNIGIIVGVIIGVIVLVAIILVIIVLQRKGKFRFERKDTFENNRTIAMDNVVYMSSNDNDAIHGGQPQYCEATAYQRRPGNDDKALTSEEENDYNTTNTRNNVDAGNHYNHLGADEDNYDTAGVNRIDNVKDNTYNHTGTHAGSRVMVDNEHDTYNHVNNDNGGSRQNAETYDRIHVGSGSGESAVAVDSCYNHLMADVDNDYDTTRPVDDNVQNDTYNHAFAGEC